MPSQRPPAFGAKQAVSNDQRTRARAEQRLITSLLMARVDELRKPRGLSLERLADASGLSAFTLYRLRQELNDPQLTTVLRLCRGLGATVGELLAGLPVPTEARPRPVPRQPGGGR